MSHNDHSADWSKVSLARFAVVGTTFTLGLETTIYPLFSIATRLQFERETRVHFLRDAWRVFRAHSFRSLYRGFGVYVIGGLPSQGVYYAGYNMAKARLGANGDDHSRASKAAMHVTAALLADVTATPLWAPFDVIAKSMVVRGGANTNYSTFQSTVKHIYRTDGPRGFFRGMSALLWTYLPTSAAWWTTYEFSKDALFQNRSHYPCVPSPALHMLSGGMAGFVAALVSNPFSLATTRLQTQLDGPAAVTGNAVQPTDAAPGHTHARHGGPRDRTLMQALRSIVQREGALALWRGLAARLTHSTIASSLSFVIYEQVLRLSEVQEVA